MRRTAVTLAADLKTEQALEATSDPVVVRLDDSGASGFVDELDETLVTDRAYEIVIHCFITEDFRATFPVRLGKRSSGRIDERATVVRIRPTLISAPSAPPAKAPSGSVEGSDLPDGVAVTDPACVATSANLEHFCGVEPREARFEPPITR